MSTEPLHVTKINLILSYREDGDIENLVEGLYVLATKQVCSDLVYDVLQEHLLLKVMIHTARENFVHRKVDTEHLNAMLFKKRTLQALVEQLVNGTQP